MIFYVYIFKCFCWTLFYCFSSVFVVYKFCSFLIIIFSVSSTNSCNFSFCIVLFSKNLQSYPNHYSKMWYPIRLISCTDSSHPLSRMPTTSGSAPIIGPSQSVTHLPNWTLFAGCCLIAATNNNLTTYICRWSTFVAYLNCDIILTLMPCPHCVCILSCVCHDLLPIKHISISISIYLSIYLSKVIILLPKLCNFHIRLLKTVRAALMSLRASWGLYLGEGGIERPKGPPFPIKVPYTKSSTFITSLWHYS